MNTCTLRALYQDELRALRKDGAEFAKRYPALAPALGVDWGTNTDPMVERLIESMAWFSARLRQDSEARLPLAAQQIMQHLYPSFASPVPSIGVASLSQREKDGEDMLVPAGTSLHCIDADGCAIRWRTAWPVSLHGTSIASHVFSSSPPPGIVPQPDTACYLLLKTSGRRCMDTIRLYLRGDPYTTHPLHELVNVFCTRLFAISKDATSHFDLGVGALQPAGLSEDHLVLPTAGYAYPAYQLAQEYFLCPERFLFWDLDLRKITVEGDVTLCFCLREHPPADLDLEYMVFDTAATPVVNLFEAMAEPLRVDHTRHKWYLNPDRARPHEQEIHSIISVEALYPGRASLHVKNYFHGRDSRDANDWDDCLRWFCRRSPNPAGSGTVTELYFHTGEAGMANAFVANARVLCTNRGRAERLGAGTVIHCDDNLDKTVTGKLQLPPTPQLDPPMFGDELWRLVSSMTLHHRSLTGPDAVNALGNILRLYAPGDSANARKQISGMEELRAEEGIEPLRPNRTLPMGGVARGCDFTLRLNRDAYRRSSAFMFTSVLSTFLSLFCSINRYTRLTVLMGDRREPYYSWPARNGWRRL